MLDFFVSDAIVDAMTPDANADAMACSGRGRGRDVKFHRIRIPGCKFVNLTQYFRELHLLIDRSDIKDVFKNNDFLFYGSFAAPQKSSLYTLILTCPDHEFAESIEF